MNLQTLLLFLKLYALNLAICLELNRGTPEHFGVEDRIAIVNSTLGKALGGASG
jgi:hypothetical protein